MAQKERRKIPLAAAKKWENFHSSLCMLCCCFSAAENTFLFCCWCSKCWRRLWTCALCSRRAQKVFPLWKFQHDEATHPFSSQNTMRSIWSLDIDSMRVKTERLSVKTFNFFPAALRLYEHFHPHPTKTSRRYERKDIKIKGTHRELITEHTQKREIFFCFFAPHFCTIKLYIPSSNFISFPHLSFLHCCVDDSIAAHNGPAVSNQWGRMRMKEDLRFIHTLLSDHIS